MPLFTESQHIMLPPSPPSSYRRLAALIVLGGTILVMTSCGYRFSGAPEESRFPPDVKTCVVESARNQTTLTGIETELTNDLRNEFALGTRLNLVRNGGDAIFRTVIHSYEDTPSMYRADGKELTRSGVLRVVCVLERSDSKKVLWKKDLFASSTYDVTDTIAGTLSNRRRAISRIIKDLVPRIHRSMYDNF